MIPGLCEFHHHRKQSGHDTCNADEIQRPAQQTKPSSLARNLREMRAQLKKPRSTQSPAELEMIVNRLMIMIRLLRYLK